MSLYSLSLLAFEEAPIGLVMTEERFIVACNRTFCEFTQYEKPELLGESFQKLYSSKREFESIRDVGLASLIEVGSYTDQRLLNRKDGSLMWCRFRAHTLTPDAPLSRTILSYAKIAEPQSEKKPLTARERDIILGLTRGLTSKEMANELGLSTRTVEDVRFRLLKKFEVRTSNELLWHFMNLEL